jgi:hypothetical protein
MLNANALLQLIASKPSFYSIQLRVEMLQWEPLFQVPNSTQHIHRG